MRIRDLRQHQVLDIHVTCALRQRQALDIHVICALRALSIGFRPLDPSSLAMLFARIGGQAPTGKP